MNAITHTNFIGPQQEAKSLNQSDGPKAKDLAKMESRATTCTPEIIAKFKSLDLPEISGDLSRKKRFLFF
jgi:hypothetical protein